MIDAVRLRIVLVALAGWVNRHQLEVIEYLREENRVLKEHLDGQRLRLTDAQRRRLAVNGHRLGRNVLREGRRWSRRTPSCGGIGSSSPVNGPLSDGASDDRGCFARSAS